MFNYSTPVESHFLSIVISVADKPVVYKFFLIQKCIVLILITFADGFDCFLLKEVYFNTSIHVPLSMTHTHVYLVDLKHSLTKWTT